MQVYLKLLAAVTLWGGTFVAGRMLGQEIGPYSSAFLRFLIASVCLMTLLLRTEKRLPAMTPRTIAGVILLGLTGVFAYNVCFFTGLQTVPASRASVTIAMNPVVIALAAAVFLGEPLSKKKILGIALSVSGAVTVISHGDPLSLLSEGVGTGDLFILGCVGSWASYSLVGKVVMGSLSPLASVALSSVAGTFLLLFPALHEGLLFDIEHMASSEWTAIVYLAVFATVVGFTWFYEGVKAIGASKAAVFINFVPVFAITSSYFILNEAVDLSLVAGAALVISGVVTTNRA